MTLDSDLRQLTMIGLVPPGGRLGHTLDGRLVVTGNSRLWRLAFRDGRDRTIAVVGHVLSSADERVCDMANSRFLAQPSKPELTDLERRTDDLTRALSACTTGIQNLKITYASDASAQAGLDLAACKATAVVHRAQALRQAITAAAAGL